MSDLAEEVKKELIEKVEGKLMTFHTINLLKMMFLDRGKEANQDEKSKHVDEMKKEAPEDAAEIIQLVRETLETGKIPGKRVA